MDFWCYFSGETALDGGYGIGEGRCFGGFGDEGKVSECGVWLKGGGCVRALEKANRRAGGIWSLGSHYMMFCPMLTMYSAIDPRSIRIVPMIVSKDHRPACVILGIAERDPIHCPTHRYLILFVLLSKPSK